MSKTSKYKVATGVARAGLIVLFAIPIFLGLFLPIILIRHNDLFVRSIIKIRSTWVEENKPELRFVFTEIFPKAEKCNDINCENGIRAIFDSKLNETLSTDFTLTGREPIYFIKIKDEKNIIKLFQGGGVKVEPVDTKRERMVTEMLLGTRKPFAFPQYHCCGGDDIVGEIPLIKNLLPPRRYLLDFPSEIEHIYIIFGENGETLGGLVYLYGD